MNTININTKKDKQNVIFFSRDYQSILFPQLIIEEINALHIALTKKEKKNIENLGGIVVGCLEEEFHKLTEANVKFPYLKYSWGSDRYLRGYSYAQRLSIERKIISFWRNILSKYNPIAVVNETVALEISEILYLESQLMNIKYIAISSYLAQDTLFFQSDPTNSTIKSFNTIEPNSEQISVAVEICSEIKKGFFKPYYTKNIKSRISPSTLLIIVKKLTLDIIKKIKVRDKVIRELCYGDQTKYNVRALKLYCKSLYYRKYNNLTEIPKNTDLYFYPIHYEPEAVTLYCAYFFNDQFGLINGILKCLSEDSILVIKEHPNQPGFLMEKQYTELRSKYPNLYILPAEVAANNIIEKSKAVITLGGTTGLEALIIGRPVILFASVYYDQFPGVYRVDSYESLYKLLREKRELKKGDNIELAVAKVLSLMKKGKPFHGKKLYDTENLKNLSSAIINEIWSE